MRPDRRTNEGIPHRRAAPGTTAVRLLVTLAWLLAAGTLLAACSEAGTVAPPGPGSYGITGTVSSDAAASAAHAREPHGQGVVLRDLGPRLTAADARADAAAVAEEIIPGEILVVFRSDAGVAARASVSVLGTALARVRTLAMVDAAVYRAAGADVAATVALAQELERRADVLAAAPNRVVRSFREPDDALYGRLWNLRAIGMPAAWDVTTGSRDVVVAVVDTGVRGRPGQPSATHPDLIGKLLPGYDFVDRDDDPFDPGSFGSNGTHGTHVAGIVAARSNDGIGIAGVDWSAMLLPVRVLGSDGLGSMADVLDGVAWAAGLSVQGVPRNATPADVVNVSLGGAGSCSSVERHVFDRVSAAGSIVVAAAGNYGADARATTPASCPTVIAVGATDREGRRAHYSNYGPDVVLMAPGGDLGTMGPDGTPNGILSAVYDREHVWGLLQGTSMAAPHVAGVVALLRSLDPGISRAEVVELLRETAVPMSTSACNGRASTGLVAADCGAGLLDAHAALRALGEGGQAPTPPEEAEPPAPPPAPPEPSPPPPEPPEPSPGLVFEPDRIEFGPNATSATLALRNASDAAISWSLRGFSASIDNPGSVGARILTVDVASGRLPAGAATTMSFTLDRDQVVASGSYRLDLVFEVGGAERIVPLHFDHADGAAARPSVSGTFLLACVPTPAGCDPLRSGEIVVSGQGSVAPYVIDGLDDREYVVIGWNDLNASGDVDAGDLFGFYTRDGVAATAVTPPATGVDVTLRALQTQSKADDPHIDALRTWLAARAAPR